MNPENWLYPAAWAGSSGQAESGKIDLAAELRALPLALQAKAAELAALNGLPAGGIALDERAEQSVADALLIYAVQRGYAPEFPAGIAVGSAEDHALLEGIYLSLNPVLTELRTNQLGAQELIIGFGQLSAFDIAASYGLLQEDLDRIAAFDLEALRQYLQFNFGSSIFSQLSIEEFQSAYASLPAEPISAQRRDVVLAGLSLKGKVKYFWGGKSAGVGWDARWGNMRTVSTPGSKTSGSYRPLGMDCSGFVEWAFVNGFGDVSISSSIGSSSATQWMTSREIDWSDAKPGDLLFRQMPSDSGINHVGIVVGRNEKGELLVVHCASSQNNVVVTGPSVFRYARRPNVFLAADAALEAALNQQTLLETPPAEQGEDPFATLVPDESGMAEIIASAEKALLFGVEIYMAGD
ncbi:MAG: C40 family peptidase [Christensenellaceae bacterium]|nr:C40 family peptidase [Christensenellaceae bacterium]